MVGEISGATFSPDGGMVFVSIVDEIYGSLLQFRKKAELM